MPYAGGTIRWVGSERPDLPEPFLEDESNRVALEVVAAAARDKRPVVLFGGVGRGKSVLLARCQLESGGVSLWTTAADYLADVQRGWQYAKQFADWGERFSADGIARRVDRLFVDDLGVERASDFGREEISGLIQSRHAAGLGTWVTTNLEMTELIERYGERTISRLLGDSSMARLEGSDRRLPS